MHAQFTVSVHEIDAGGLARSFDLPLAWLQHALGDTGVSATGPGKADVRLSKVGHDVIVNGKVSASLTMPCARCLKDVAIPVDTELSLVLRPAKSDHAHAAHTHGAHGHAAHGAHADKDAAPKASKDAAKDAAKPARDTGAKPAKDVAKPARDAAARPARDAAKTNGAPKKRAHDEEDEYEFSAEEADSDLYDGETVVLDPFLREAILLEAPSFPLCSEDCPGIRPTAKAAPERGEPVLDPRLSPLRALKTKLMLAATSKDAPGAAPRDPEGESKDAPGNAAERPVQGGKAFSHDGAADRASAPYAPSPRRPKIQAHRTQGSIGASGAQAKARAKHSPKKRAK